MKKKDFMVLLLCCWKQELVFSIIVAFHYDTFPSLGIYFIKLYFQSTQPTGTPIAIMRNLCFHSWTLTVKNFNQ